MAEAAIAQIDWSSGIWTKCRRRYINSALQPSITHAEGYLSDVLGVEPTVTRVLPYIGWCGSAPRAASLSPTTIEFYFSRAEIDRQKLHRIDQEMTPVGVHEMMHSAREHEFPHDNSVIERIASEGLAYTAQAYAEQDIFDVPYEKTVLHDNINGNLMLEMLYNDPLCYKDITTGTYEELWKNDWLYGAKKEPFSWGQRLGIWCVKSMIDDYGFDFPQLLKLPSEEIIAL